MDHQDVLSDVFSTLQLRGGLYFRADLAGAFAVTVPAEPACVRLHFLRRGSCWVGDEAEATALQLHEGDLALLPNGTAHVLADRPGRDPQPLAAVMDGVPLDDSGTLRYGTGEGRAELLCGFCRLDAAIDHPLLACLPGMIVLRAQDLGAQPWTLAALRLLALETELAEQGMQGILGRLLEILLIQTLRQNQPGNEEGVPDYMTALADRHLAAALRAIHNQPQRSWTVTGLAKVAGMSRARFAERFNSQVGQAPIAYLTTWRLMKARQLLRNSDLATAEIAARCGYASLPSFTRRYKAAFGIGPGAFRRSARQS
ncbi:AraC family transcriptional regulator [Pelagibius sp.]|uniref:AraC family transcriptional regulator n=1 Tax=Pelagibius sp. TaxID=1931238 RepID=UPI003BB1326B